MHSLSREKRARSILKMLTWRTVGSAITGLLVFFISHKRLDLGLAVGVSDLLLKPAAQYLFERIWAHIPWGYKLPVSPESINDV